MAYGSHEMQNEIFDLQKELERTEDLLSIATEDRDKYKEKYDKLSSEFEAIDGAAEYWKNEFEMLYNRIYDLIITDSDFLPDGECIDAIWSHLESVDGQSDEQKCTKSWNEKRTH